MHSEKRKMLLEAIANVSENEKILAKDTVGRKQKKISSPNSPVWHISYNGRVHRAAFFLMIILFISKTVISKELLARFEIGSAAIPLAIIEIIFLAWAISISIRRLHDINRS